MKVNTGKNQLLLSGNSRATIDHSSVESEDKPVLGGITTDSKLTFENHIITFARKQAKN